MVASDALTELVTDGADARVEFVKVDDAAGFHVSDSLLNRPFTFSQAAMGLRACPRTGGDWLILRRVPAASWSGSKMCLSPLPQPPAQAILTATENLWFENGAASQARFECGAALGETTRTRVDSRATPWSHSWNQGRRAWGIVRPRTRSTGIRHRSRPSLLGSGSLLHPKRSGLGRSSQRHSRSRSY
jgi:hypothetical protein